MVEKGKVLVVDDELDFVDTLRTILESADYKVSVAYSGREGLEVARREKPNLIILDIMMERKDTGFSVCWKLKHDPECKDIPILILTAVTERTGFRFAPDEEWLPADDYVDKPIAAEDLLKKVKKFVGK